MATINKIKVKGVEYGIMPDVGTELTDEEKQAYQKQLGIIDTIDGINNILNKLMGNE